MATRPVYSKLVLPSRKSLEIIINIKIENKKIKIYLFFFTKNGGCPLIRACLLIRSNTVYMHAAHLHACELGLHGQLGMHGVGHACPNCPMYKHASTHARAHANMHALRTLLGI